MTLLFIACRYHDTDPNRGHAAQALGLCRALRKLGQPVVFIDPFDSPAGVEPEERIAETLLANPVRAIIAMGPQPAGWTGWPVVAGHVTQYSVPLAAIDVTDPVCMEVSAVQFASCRHPGAVFLPPAVDTDVYRPRGMVGSAPRELAFAFVGKLTPQRRESLSHLADLPGFVHESSRLNEPRIPQHSMAALLARSVAGIDLPGDRSHAVHSRVFEALAANAYPVVPFCDELATCLEPGKEVLVYHDGGEMVELVRELHQDPARLAGLLAAGRKRVLEQHGFGARAGTVLAGLADLADLADQRAGTVAAEPVKEPKVTVYMPVRNASRHLSKTLDSVLGQTWRNLHVLALDDASTDCTLEILRARAARDSRLQVLHYETHRGEVVRRNDALMHLSEDAVYLSNHDADDVSDPTRIQRLVEFLEANPTISHVGCQAQVIDANGNLCDYRRLPTDPDEIDRTAHEVNPLLNSATVYRRLVLDRLSGYRNVFRTVDDYDFWGRALEAGFRLANLPDPLLQIRVHDQNVSTTNRSRQEQLRHKVGARLQSSQPWRLAQRQGKSMQMRAVLHGAVGASSGRLSVDGARGLSAAFEEDFHYLRLPPGCCAELWAHRCLEQLPRAAGFRMLIEWHLWLQENGQLVIETPDLDVALDRLYGGGLRRSELLRHLFGGQATGAAAHHDAYSEARLRELLTRLGFTVEGVTSVDRDGLPFIIAQCRKHSVSVKEQNYAALDLLEDFLVDTSEVDVRGEWLRQLVGEPSMGNEECAS